MVLLPVLGKSQSYRVNPSKIIALGLNYRSHIAESHSVKVSGFTEEVPYGTHPVPKDPKRAHRAGRTYRDTRFPARIRV